MGSPLLEVSRGYYYHSPLVSAEIFFEGIQLKTAKPVHYLEPFASQAKMHYKNARRKFGARMENSLREMRVKVEFLGRVVFL